MGTRRAIAVLVATVCAAGCGHSAGTATPGPATSVSSPSPSPAPATALTDQRRADQVCRRAAPNDFYSALPTTVGAIHAVTSGPPASGKANHPFALLLPHAAVAGFAAWCWHRPTPDHYKLLLVGPSGEVVDTGQQQVGSAPPRGPLT